MLPKFKITIGCILSIYHGWYSCIGRLSYIMIQGVQCMTSRAIVDNGFMLSTFSNWMMHLAFITCKTWKNWRKNIQLYIFLGTPFLLIYHKFLTDLKLMSTDIHIGKNHRSTLQGNDKISMQWSRIQKRITGKGDIMPYRSLFINYKTQFLTSSLLRKDNKQASDLRDKQKNLGCGATSITRSVCQGRLCPFE